MKTKHYFEQFAFKEARSETARGRLQFLCDLINDPPVWLNKDGLQAFLRTVQLTRHGHLPEVASTEETSAIFYDGAWHVGLSFDGLIGGDPPNTLKWLYTFWITNPMRDSFDGPCPGRRNGQTCERYYVRRTEEQKCCSRVCGKDAAASNVYARKRDEKLDTARKILRKWKPSRQWPDWKRFVVANHPQITKNFLTHAVKKGDLKPPKGEE